MYIEYGPIYWYPEKSGPWCVGDEVVIGPVGVSIHSGF